VRNTAKVLTAVLTLALFLCPLTGRPQERPVKVAPGDLVTDYHGVKVANPYRALENLKSSGTQEWAAAQAAYTRRQFDRLPGRKALLDRITALDAERSAVITSLSVTPTGQWFYLKRSGGCSHVREIPVS